MAEPWEQDWSQGAPVQVAPQTAAPWDHDWSTGAPPAKSFTEKLGETWPARLAKSVYSGVTLPGDVYQGNTQVDPSNPEFMGRTMDLATVASPVAPRAATSIAPAIGAPTAEMLGDAANKGYDAVRNSGVEYAPQSVANMAGTLAQGLETKGINATRAPQTHDVVSGLANPPAGAVSATIGNIDTARQALGHIASDQSYSATDRKAAEIGKRHIDEYLSSVPTSDVLAGDAPQAAKSLKDAQGNYAAKMRSETITGAQDVAEGNAAAANSGRNIDNAYRQRFNSILKSDKQSYGFSPEELARMEQLRNGTPGANAMRMAGNFMGGGGGMGAAITAALGGWVNPILAGTPVVGAFLKKGADLSTLRQIKALDEAARARSPLGQEMANGPATMSPADQLRQSAVLKALMTGAMPANQGNADQSALIKALMGAQ